MTMAMFDGMMSGHNNTLSEFLQRETEADADLFGACKKPSSVQCTYFTQSSVDGPQCKLKMNDSVLLLVRSSGQRIW